jgi:hypothetical protein
MRNSFLIVLFTGGLFLTSLAMAEIVVVRWGGPGYDPAARGKNNSSLFSAYPDMNAPSAKSSFQIWVDSEKTVQGVGRMVVRQEGQREIVSQNCFKAQLHIDAPYACRFKKADFFGRKGSGELVVFDRDGQKLLKSIIDFLEIKKVF